MSPGVLDDDQFNDNDMDNDAAADPLCCRLECIPAQCKRYDGGQFLLCMVVMVAVIARDPSSSPIFSTRPSMSLLEIVVATSDHAIVDGA
jgi:hypothetical protein